MSFKVVLACLPFFNHVYTPPLPLAYLKASLQKEKGLIVKAIDFEPVFFRSFLNHNNSTMYWDRMTYRDKVIGSVMRAELDKYVQMILSESPRVVGFSVAFSNYLFTRYISQELKRINSEIYIIYGGRYFCLRKKFRHWVKDWHLALQDVDCIVKNEGEATLMEIVRLLRDGEKPSSCAGATLRFNNEIMDGGDRPLISELDSIPFPDFSDFHKKDYLSDYVRIVFSRGCVGRCVYCVENGTMGEYRSRSPQNVLAELKLRIQQGYHRFQLCDLALNSDLENLINICKLIIQENLKIEFTFSEFRNSSKLTPEIFALLYKAGFRTICYGTESGCQEILDKMGKGTTLEAIERNFKNAHEQGLKTIVYMMVGFPGENEGTFQETVAMFSRNKNFIDGVTAIAPTCICWGSRIHEDITKYDIKADTLFHDPDRWEAMDGKNSLSWRLELSERLRFALKEMGIPMVNFMTDANPQIPFVAYPEKRKISHECEVSEKPGMLQEGFFSAKLTALINNSDVSVNEKFVFWVGVENTGTATWCINGDDWIRVGCKIFSGDENGSNPSGELRQEIPGDIKPGGKFEVVFRINRNDLSHGKCFLKFDMVNEGKFWFEQQGNGVLAISL